MLSWLRRTTCSQANFMTSSCHPFTYIPAVAMILANTQGQERRHSAVFLLSSMTSSLQHLWLSIDIGFNACFAFIGWLRFDNEESYLLWYGIEWVYMFAAAVLQLQLAMMYKRQQGVIWLMLIFGLLKHQPIEKWLEMFQKGKAISNGKEIMINISDSIQMGVPSSEWCDGISWMWVRMWLWLCYVCHVEWMSICWLCLLKLECDKPESDDVSSHAHTKRDKTRR